MMWKRVWWWWWWWWWWCCCCCWCWCWWWWCSCWCSGAGVGVGVGADVWPFSSPIPAQLFHAPGQAVAGLSQDVRVQQMSSFVASRGGEVCTARLLGVIHVLVAIYIHICRRPSANQAWQWEMARSCIDDLHYDLPIQQSGDVHSYVKLPEGSQVGQVGLCEWNITYVNIV